MRNTLDLGLIGNCHIGALIDEAGEIAWCCLPRAVYDQPDAGMWELRGMLRVHTFSSVMCWAACERLARIAAELGLGERAAHWRGHANRVHTIICARAWNSRKQAFVAVFEGDALDASMLLLHDVGFLAADDPRFTKTVEAVERELKQGSYVHRPVEPDDFGVPEDAFVVCTSGTSMPWRRLAAVRKPESCSKTFSPGATATGSLPNTLPPIIPASSGATSSRPTARWG